MLKPYNTALYSNTLPSQGRAEEEFYATERVSSRIGGGMANVLVDPLNSALLHLSKYDYTAIAADIMEMMMRSIECTDMPGQYVSMEFRLNTIEESMGWLNPEENRYIYHSDHLGSSAFLTDASGTPTQHLQYLPFGENFIEQRTTTDYYSPYTFSAKERDMETGYSYFGARYYDADISVWLSVDPMVHKYPSMSAYMYVGGNPIKFIDPDGNRIIAVGAISQFYVKSYLKEHFGNSKAFKVTNSGEVKINQRKFDKQYKNATSDQKILMDGFKEAIHRDEVAQIHVNQESDNFELTQPIPGSDNEYFRDITSDMPGGTIPPDRKFTDFYVLINDKRANNDELNAVDGGKTGKSASSTFFHEVLDEFLNYYTKKTVDDNSSKADKVKYHNAALRNIGKKERDGSEHQ